MIFGTSAARWPLALLKLNGVHPPSRSLQTCAILSKSQSGRHSPSIKHNKPLTYEQAQKPNEIAMRKSWNSMNTSALDFDPLGKFRLGARFGLRTSQTVNEDIFIRRFLVGTWHNLFLSEVLIKRQANMIRIAGIVLRAIPPRKMYFLIATLKNCSATAPVPCQARTTDCGGAEGCCVQVYLVVFCKN
ncbi:28S ribosomal protein S24, mitochondrial [Orchesella cincta]|uniref:28S ribosomal protein S24, mitochondrial n=1 Tax=Orchesella cincta TaxID=48709 RepID=A0A1D2MC42_ORCCI|nr:28S ribosomal protein S24, mitochondrial [Orchesella cincta]